jgi:putative transposase
VISDGAPGLISAVEQTMPAALRQRRLIHRCRNILSKIPRNAQAEVKAGYWAIFELPDTCRSSPTHALAQLRTLLLGGRS